MKTIAKLMASSKKTFWVTMQKPMADTSSKRPKGKKLMSDKERLKTSAEAIIHAATQVSSIVHCCACVSTLLAACAAHVALLATQYA
jgi:hypothetical protein